MLSIIHDMNTNFFLSRMYLAGLSGYVVFFLPYRLLKCYNDIITETNSKDYIQTFIVNNFKKIVSKMNSEKNQ